MSRIFLSHSSHDDLAAVALRDWLAAEGWDDVFLDFDPNRGIVAGQRWERRLHEAASRCEAVVFLVSAHWLASGWCMKEYTTARRLNKKLFAVLIDPAKTLADLPPELTDTWQVTDLAGGTDMVVFRAVRPGTQAEAQVAFNRDGLTRLKRGLQKAGLDARFFAWPPEGEPARSPYRGLKPLEAADAGIFFGRDAPIVEATDRMRGLGTGAPPRLMVILGASGAGKSSFLRAGLLPRLARDDTHFVVLPPIRPERAAISGENGFLRALATACPSRTPVELAVAVAAGAAALRPILAELVDAAFRRTLAEAGSTSLPTVVIAIDQAEELFRAEGLTEAQALLGLVRDLAVSDDPVAVIVIFAIRSDSYDALEHARVLEGLRQDTIPLLPMPRGAYKEVIESPALRATEAGGKLAIEPQLTEKLLADIQRGAGSDALPLLAFTLEQLYIEYQHTGVLTLANYEAAGGIGGAIDAAVARAFARADADPRIPREPAVREKLLRRGLIPWLAGVDPDTKSPRRNIARLADIPAEAAPLIDLLVEERMLSTDIQRARDPASGAETQVTTIEPTHEALLRQWGLLDGWLAEDFGLLATLEGVQRAVRDWDANGRDPAWLAHGGGRLAEAQGLDVRPDIAVKLDATDRAYIAACREREDAMRAEAEQRRLEREAEQERRVTDAQALTAATRRTAQRTRIGLIVALVLAAAAAGFGLFAKSQKTLADQKTVEATAQTIEAKTQRDAATRAEALATQQKTIADQQTVEAKTQRDAAGRAEASAKQQTALALAAKQESDRQAGLLAADTAQTYTAGGDFDAASLLLMRASKAFPSDAVPDKLRIAFSDLLDRRAKVRVQTIPTHSATIETDDAIFITNDKARTILAYDDGGLKTILSNDPNTSPVFTMRRLADGSNLIVRKNGGVDALCKGCQTAQHVYAFLDLDSATKGSRAFEMPVLDIAPTGMVMKAYRSLEDLDTSISVVDVFDYKSRLSGRLVYKLFYSKISSHDKETYVHDITNFFAVRPQNEKLAFMPAKLGAEQRDEIAFGGCLSKMPAGARPAVRKDLKKLQPDANLVVTCRNYVDDGLVTSITSSSSGPQREDEIFDAGGNVSTVSDLLVLTKSGLNISSVSFDPAIHQIAAAQNRDVHVFTKDPAYGVGYISDHKSQIGADVVAFKTVTPPTAIRFSPGGHLGVVEADAGRLTVFDTLPITTAVHTIVKTGQSGGTGPTAAQFGGCSAGRTSQFQEGSRTAADGSQIQLTNLSDKDQKLGLVVHDKTGKITKTFSLNGSCLAMSDDLDTVVVVAENKLSIYSGFLRAGDLGTRVDYPVVSDDIQSVTFQTNIKAFVTCDETDRVTQWRFESATSGWAKSELFRGDYPISYAEIDKSGRRLIVIERIDSDTVHGFLYSLEAQQRWYDLGRFFRDLGAYFTANDDVAVFEEGKLSDIFKLLPSPSLYALAAKSLSPTCQWSEGKPFTNSPCWPQTIR